MATLLDGIVERLVPPFALSKTEGDAVFVFSSEGDVRGHGVLACLDGCYRSFKSRIAALEAALTCNCSACTLGIALDLKFILHAGTFVVHPVAGREELLGPDVNAVHRLLKNHAVDLIGGDAYALFTQAAALHLALPLDGAAVLTETYDHFEPIDSYVYSLPLRTLSGE
jgi:hypothetical protein